MGMNDWLDAGKNIMDDIQYAVSHNDYSHLEGEINAEVSRAKKGSVAQNRQQSYFLVRKVNRDAGMPKIIVGGFGIAFNIFLLIGSVIGLFASAAAVVGVILGAGFLAAFSKIFKDGKNTRLLVQKYYEYGSRLGGAEYFNVGEFAKAVGIPEREMKGQLQSMIRMGYLPQAKFDDSGTTLILSNRAYQMYLRAKYAWQSSQQHTRTAGMTSGQTGAGQVGAAPMHGFGSGTAAASGGSEAGAASAAGGNSAAGGVFAGAGTSAAGSQDNLSPEIREAITKGQAYIRHIREVNDAIPDTEEMSNKLYKLEDITNRIFERMQKHPESVPNMKKFMEYYLPTTQKLMDAYVEVYNQPEAGENIRETKQEIEKSIDLVNQAYEKLLDGMFEDTAWDVSSDINVMKTMMSQDGLSDEGQMK